MNWRLALARLSLPLLALPASYGVYQFNILFLPVVMAIISAAAFEFVYVGLAVVPLRPEQRGQARIIAIAAVFTSMLYNTLAGLFHLRSDLLDGMPLWAIVTLAVLHGVPLAALAYAVADLLFHQDEQQHAAAVPEREPAQIVRLEPHAPAYECDQCGKPLNRGQWMAMRRFGYCSSCKNETVGLSVSATTAK